MDEGSFAEEPEKSEAEETVVLCDEEQDENLNGVLLLMNVTPDEIEEDFDEVYEWDLGKDNYWNNTCLTHR